MNTDETRKKLLSILPDERRSLLTSAMRSMLRSKIMPEAKKERSSSLEEGKQLRKKVKRSAHAAWEVVPDRAGPLRILEEQEKDRLQPLLSIRHERMRDSAFAYFRGTAAVMANDLAKTPVSGILVQACGDAHIGNFGVFSAADRRLVFDINDFDETYPGPWEWDVKRLAASIEICGRFRGFDAAQREKAVRRALDSYHDAMTTFSGMGTMDMWYSHLDIEQMLENHRHSLPGETVKMIDKVVKSASTKNSYRAVRKWTETVDGKLRIRSIPPILIPYRDLQEQHDTDPEKVRSFLKIAIAQYRMSLPADVRRLIDQYTPADIAHKVVGVGSVGMRSFILVMEGCDTDDPLVLQLKEATHSVLTPYVDLKQKAVAPLQALLANNGRRVVEGQKAIQTSGDILLGWMRVADLDGQMRDFYVRQLWNNKGTIDLTTLSCEDLAWLSEICGWTLAHAHARTGDRHAIAGYLGKGRRFEEAAAEFAVRYADQNDADYQVYVSRCKD